MQRWTPEAGATSRSCRCRTIRTGSAGRCRSAARDLSAAGVRRRGAQSQASLWRASPQGEAFLLQGGDCAESFAEHRRQQHPRLLPRVPADGGRADLCGGLAGGEGRPHRRPVRQAALRRRPRSATASSCRATAATSSTASTSRRRRACPIRAASSRPTGQSAATLNLLRAFAHGGYANLQQRARVDAGLRQGQPAVAPLRGARRPHRRDARLSCSACGLDLESHPELRDDRFLHQPRGVAARLRAGADPRRTRPTGRLVRTLGPHGLDRRPHAPGRSRACRVLPRHQEPARPQMRAVAEAPTICCG